MASRPLKLAIVHDWLVQPGGAELVLREAFRVFPDATLFALIDHMPAGERAALALPAARTSWLQRVPGVAQSYRRWLPLMPMAARSLDTTGFDAVLSISHAVAHGVHVQRGTPHLSLCLSPMRYAWDLREQYLQEAGLDRGLTGWAARVVLERMRRWDRATSARVTAFASISRFIADRVQRAYARPSEIIYPPVDTEYFTPLDIAREAFYVTASRFVPYKRVDLIARAFSQGHRKLVIIGDGPDWEKVRAVAGPNVTLLGRQSREVVRDHLRRARAFVFAAEEDFGIAPVEAQACGTPVIAYGRGGVLETVVPPGGAGASGVFFTDQSEAGLRGALDVFDALQPAITGADCRRSAERFSVVKFHDQLRAWVARATSPRGG